MTKYTRTIMSYADVIPLSKMIETRCKKVDGFARYEDGWDDQRVVDEMNKAQSLFTYKLSHVVGLRRQFIGDRASKGPSRKIGEREILNRLERLEEWARLRPVGAFPSDPNAPIVPAPGAKGK